MIHNITKTILVAVIIGVVGFAVTRTANAADVVVDVTAPDRVEVGQPAELQALVRSADAGLPVANAAIAVYSDAAFAGVEGEVKLGTALTDENGVASLTFEPSFASAHELRFEYVPTNGGEPQVFTKTIDVAESVAQLEQSVSGVQVPGLNVWLIMAIISAVWFLLFSVGVRVLLIARAAPEAEGAIS